MMIHSRMKAFFPTQQIRATSFFLIEKIMMVDATRDQKNIPLMGTHMMMRLFTHGMNTMMIKMQYKRLYHRNKK